MKSATAMDGRLYGLLAELGSDEKAVMLAAAERLLRGQKEIGRLDLARDPRDWMREAQEEGVDMAIYLCFLVVKWSILHEDREPPALPDTVRESLGMQAFVAAWSGANWFTPPKWNELSRESKEGWMRAGEKLFAMGKESVGKSAGGLTRPQVDALLAHLEEMREAADEEARKDKPRVLKERDVGMAEGFSYCRNYIASELINSGGDG